MLVSTSNYLFDHSQIEEIHFMGLIDDEEEEFRNKLSEAVKEIKS